MLHMWYLWLLGIWLDWNEEENEERRGGYERRGKDGVGPNVDSTAGEVHSQNGHDLILLSDGFNVGMAMIVRVAVIIMSVAMIVSMPVMLMRMSMVLMRVSMVLMRVALMPMSVLFFRLFSISFLWIFEWWSFIVRMSVMIMGVSVPSARPC